MRSIKTVNEVSKLTGVSVRALQYYDRIGLLRPTEYSDAGYRLYDDAALEKLQQIMLFRELEFPLKDISVILSSPDFDRTKALEQQIELLTLKKEHLENLILLAQGIKMRGVRYLDFKPFDTSKLDEYAAQAKESWSSAPAYREYEEKSKGRTKVENNVLEADLMGMFADFGIMKDSDPASCDVQAKIAELQAFISKNFYNCTNEILSALGKMYAGGGDFTSNIDSVGGEGTAEFVKRAIDFYCK